MNKENHVLIALQKLIEKNSVNLPNNFSQTFNFDDTEYVYMSEVDPHIDDWDGSETKWKIEFFYINPNYTFIYRLNGKLHKIKPELNRIYEFEFLKYHALLLDSNLENFHKRKFWKSWKNNQELSCIFQFID